MKKNYIVFVRDHTGSMRSIVDAARKDYNSTIETVKSATLATNQDTIVSVVKCGHGDEAIVHNEIIHSSIAALQPIAEGAYRADARGTPLFASIYRAIELLKATPDYNDPEVSFLINATTDGGETEDRNGGPALGRMIKELQSTDRWTFTFRVPRGVKQALVRHGIAEGNILEWDQSAKGMATAQAQSKEAFTEYFTARSTGARSTSTFYANMKDVKPADVAKALEEISANVVLWTVAKAEDGSEIRPFVESRLKGESLLKGAAFYQLTKVEKKIQDHKRIVIRDKTSKAIYGGDAARTMLGLPAFGDVRLVPKDLGNYDVFIQSTSVNRKVPAGSEVLYWSAIGEPFKEGPSAR